MNLGIHYDFIKDSSDDSDGKARPPEYECHLRYSLCKTWAQLRFHPYASMSDRVEITDRRDTWYVDGDGANAEYMVEDAAKRIDEEGLPWFDRYHDARKLLNTIQHDGETDCGTWGMGRNPSPRRTLLEAFTALHLRDVGTADRCFDDLLATDVYEHLHDRLRRERARMRG